MQQVPPSIWEIGSIEEEPRTGLMNWRIFEVALKEDSQYTLHVVGYAWLSQQGRVTSAIQALDLKKMIAKTESGRLYDLCGEPGYRSAAEFVWREWLVKTGARVIGEVTREVIEGRRQLPAFGG